MTAAERRQAIWKRYAFAGTTREKISRLSSVSASARSSMTWIRKKCCVNEKRAELLVKSSSQYSHSFQRQFFPFTSAFNCATTAKTKGKNGAVSLLLCLLKKLLYGLS